MKKRIDIKNEPIYKNDSRFKPTKNESSKRIISVNDSFLDILKNLKDNDDEFFMRPFKNRKVPGPEGVGRTLKGIINKQLDFDLPGFHFHSLRALLRYYDVD